METVINRRNSFSQWKMVLFRKFVVGVVNRCNFNWIAQLRVTSKVTRNLSTVFPSGETTLSGTSYRNKR